MSAAQLTNCTKNWPRSQSAENDAERLEEIGDLLFTAVNIARHMGVDAETALKSANGKFEKRFRAMEAMAGTEFADLDLDGKEALWTKVKAEL